MLRSLALRILTLSLPLVLAVPSQAADRVQIQAFARSVLQAGDAGGRAFAVVDKPSATLWVFDRSGVLIGDTPVLVGAAVGDVAPLDIGARPLSQIGKSEKITAAGRYLTEPGVNAQGEDIVWLDYDAALSMHRVRHVRGEHRPERLAAPGTSAKRISFGCINLPPAFYDRTVAPLFSQHEGVVYVLPEQHAISDFFPFAQDSNPNDE